MFSFHQSIRLHTVTGLTRIETHTHTHTRTHTQIAAVEQIIVSLQSGKTRTMSSCSTTMQIPPLSSDMGAMGVMGVMGGMDNMSLV